MKKIVTNYITILIETLVTILSFSSCTDQNDVNIVYHHDATIEINTLNLYETSGIDVVKFQGILGDDYKPYITLLIYNPDGSLNYKDNKIVDNLRPVSFDLKDLDQLEYTIIAIQHFVKYREDIFIVDNEVWTVPVFESPWILKDDDRLESVYVTADGSNEEIPWFECLGIGIQKTKIEKDSKISIAPKLAGSFVNLQYENLDKRIYNNKSVFNRIGLYFKEKADGIYLSPVHTGHDRYYYNGFTGPTTWRSVAEFYSENGLPTFKAIDEDTFFILQSGKINCCIGLSTKSDEHEDGSINFTAFPSTDFYSDFDEGGFYTAFCYYNGSNNTIETYIGEKSEFSKWYDSIEKWIFPVIFETPYIVWGSSLTDVESYMENKSYAIGVDLYESDGVFLLGYYGKFSEDGIYYAFASETGDLLASLVYVSHSEATPEQIQDMFNNDSQFTRIEDFEECYQEYGCYVYINHMTQVEIYPNIAWDDGTSCTQIVYGPNTEEQETAMAKSKGKRIVSNL